MSSGLIAVLALLLAAIAMFALNRPRMDAVALLMIIALPFTGLVTEGRFTGVVTVNEALAGFADPNIVLIAALFVIGEGLVRTGVARVIGDWLIRTTGRSETKLLAFLMLCVCLLGAFMSSTAVTAIFIPVALRISATTGASPGRLMMPLSFAALISGMLTLVATAPNLVVSGELERQGFAPFSFFAFTPFGLPILALGILYMLFARRWLPATTPTPVAPGAERPSFATWVETYQLAGREYRLRVAPRSALVGHELLALDLRGSAGANILAIERGGRVGTEVLHPDARTKLEAGDVILVDLSVPTSTVEQLCHRYGLEVLPLIGAYLSDRSQDIGMAEVIVPADSELVGKTFVETAFRSRTGLTVIGIRRGKEALDGALMDERIRLGDTLLVAGRWSRIERVQQAGVGVVLLRLPVEREEVLAVPGKAIQAVGCLVLVVALMVTGIVPNVTAALIGCLLMGALGCVDFASAYRSIGWKTLILIVGMLPFSLALQRTGGVDLAADGLMSLTDGAGPRVVLAALFVITAVLGMFISNTATAVLMAPVAIAVANELSLAPQPFAMIVALAASTAFITPVSSPVNTLVVTPGNYSFGDFVKVGAPFAVVVMIVSVLLVPVLLPFA